MKTDFGWNLGYVDDLYANYLENPESVSQAWREFFADYKPTVAPARGTVASSTTSTTHSRSSAGSSTATTAAVTTPAVTPAKPAPADPEDPGIELRGVGARIVENMEASLGVPTATSVRDLPVKLLEENRRIINNYRVASARPKVSFTHLIAWGVVRALQLHPSVNHGYEERDGKPFRLARQQINLGLAIDIEKRGERQLLVPNIKDAGTLHFGTFLDAYNELIAKARNGKLTLDDFQGTTVTITNPGMIGTVLSVPRLMAGQGCIVGVGSIGYPPEYAGLTPEAVAQLGLSRRLTLTSTYDHRVVQGAESGAFLASVERLLLGAENFYDDLFGDLSIPHEPMLWCSDDTPPILGAMGEQGRAAHKQARVLQLIDSYRTRGHLHANTDPLGTVPEPQSELELHTYDLSVWDLDRKFWAQGLAGVQGTLTLRTILETLRQTYCRYVGVEYMHNPRLEERLWLQERMESTRNAENLCTEEKLRILTGLNAAEAFERFLHNTYIGHKRFSLEGAESLIPVLDNFLTRAADEGVNDVVIGMAHRGRLNVLTNIVGKPLNKIFEEFEALDPDSIQGSGDVKYHLGAKGVHRTADGREVQLTIASNPSHLESVDPVVEGIVRARQSLSGDHERKHVMPLLIHGDAAFAGQGVVTETLNLSMLSGYRTGGTVHIIINNQIGFTTSPVDARSSQYATDVAKTVGAPILHVNGDHPEAAVAMIRLALSYRQKWHRDVVVDLVCYRRWGHNEGDEPTYTQPIMYERIKNRRSVRKIYTERLLRRGDIDLETAERMLNDFQERLDTALKATKDAKAAAKAPVVPLPDMEHSEGAARPHVETGAPLQRLQQVLSGIDRTPEQFEVHPKLARQLAKRQERFENDRIDWGLAETLAFGTLVLEGKDIRLSGQDSGRATFSQRHAIVYDHRNAEAYVPLQHLAAEQGRFSVFDSSLSEFAVLGFEYGYSVENPKALVMWEAQFGDFVNGAQVIIDQYLSSAEEKWGQRCNLVLLLPHGYEGQGPEHSSARLERFLQLTSEGNMQVCYPSTPAQYFHLLRRQVSRSEHKPLIVMTPKSLLRLPAAVSAVADLEQGHFRETIDDPHISDPREVKRLLLCSGKVYYDLVGYRQEHGIEQAAIARVEQFYPFADEQISALFERYSNANDVVWVQEEPRNMGAWDFIDMRFVELLLPDQTLRYAGRPWSASPATGSHLRHSAEQDLLMKQAFDGVLATTGGA